MKITKIEKIQTDELKYNGNYARGLLKRLGKANKKQEDIDSWNNMTLDLQNNAYEMGIPQGEIKALISDMIVLANYSFNKSHALAYSMMAAWTLYLNVYFKKFYYPAVIEYDFEHDKDTLNDLKDMRKNGFNVHQPDINSSKSRTFANGNDIYIGLHNLKQVGSAADGICIRSPYESFDDFLKKNLHDSKVNKRALTALVEFGCFDEIESELTRRQMIACFNKFWETKPALKKISTEDAERIKTDEELRNKLISAFNEKVGNTIEYWESIKNIAMENDFVAKIDRTFLKECEAKYLGFNFFVTPFSGETAGLINSKIAEGRCVESFEALRKFNDISKVVPVYISSIREYKDKNGGNMAFLTLEDRIGETISLPIFASVYPYVEQKIAPDTLAFMLLYNTDNNYSGGKQIMFGAKKKIAPEKFSSFIIPLRQGTT